MVATSGDILVSDEVIASIKNDLINKSFLITPNIYEAEILSETKVNNIEDQIAYSPIDLMQQWNTENIVKVGNENKLVINILDSSLTKSEIDNITIVFLKQDECLNYLSIKGPKYFKEKYVIAYMPFELENWPKELNEVFNFIDEVWAPSKFIFDSIKETKVKKKLMP